MSDLGDQEWAAFAGLAGNQALGPHERLGSALRAIELLEKVLEKTRAQTVQITIEAPEDIPPAWKELIEGLTIMSIGQVNRVSPFHCEHDELRVMADPASFSAEILAKLEELGFHQSEEGNFYSYRYGSA